VELDKQDKIEGPEFINEVADDAPVHTDLFAEVTNSDATGGRAAPLPEMLNYLS
jgi:hypothetical protein